MEIARLEVAMQYQLSQMQETSVLEQSLGSHD